MSKNLAILSAFLISSLFILPAHSDPFDAGSREFICEFFNSKGPKPGTAAPDFTLEWSRGTTIQASDFWQKKPLVVVTGSYSCPMFRENSPARKALVRDFGSRVNFIVVYTTEAHPNDALSPYSSKPLNPMRNQEEHISVSKAKTYRERMIAARQCVEVLDLASFVVVDTMSDAVWKAYGGSPNCAYLIGTDGKVILQQGLGDPAAMRTELEKLFPR